ncbi:MAG: D-alanyl-D-alanine carboxypeptidase family protein [Emergencia sp.]
MSTENRALIKRLIVFLFVFLTAAWPAADVFADAGSGERDEAPHSKAAILYEATTDTVFYEKNADMELPPASMTKVMTAILVLEENPDLEGTLTVSENAVKHYYCSSMEYPHLKAGEIISYKDCMTYMLVPSANEAATSFAFEIGGDMETFVQMMNDKAEELGCEHTHFQDPAGLSSSDHYTTPRDMVKICRYAMSFDQFREAVSKSEGTVPASNMRDEGYDYYTTNYVKFPDDRYESPYSRYVTGVKTGWTPAAGWCFSGCMEKDGLVWYSVVMGGDEEWYDENRIVQGDFVDTIHLYSLTEGVTAEDLEAMHSGFPVAAAVVIAVIAAIVLLTAVYILRKKSKEK